MLRAYSGMPADEFISQLRTYVIAMGLGPQVVDCVDNLTGIDADEDEHAIALQEAEEQGEKHGRESMKEEMIADVTRWLEDRSTDDNAGVEAVLALLEKVEV